MTEMEKPIYVTQPFLPPLEEFTAYLREIWSSKVVTNMGPYHAEFEKALADFLGVKFISLFTNGTLALITALQTLRITGEVITTPFSFVATTHSLWWNNIKPVFVDIEEESCNLNPTKIESAITPDTSAILPVHVYGNPCNHNDIQKIADRYGLKVIYDAAHAFGVSMNGQSIMNFGDMSVLSFHATKSFNTIEGGAIVCNDKETKQRIDYLKNFGFEDELTVVTPGINGKMNEFQAAFGILQLKYFDEIRKERKRIAENYRQLLADIDGIRCFQDIENTSHNYTYFPVFIEEEKFGHSRDFVYERLKQNNIFSRRYFYPLISNMPSYNKLPSANPRNLPIANLTAEQVLCLPIFPDLSLTDIQRIVKIIKEITA